VHYKHLYLTYTLLVSAILGFVLLFPFPFNDRYTCIYHRIQGNTETEIHSAHTLSTEHVHATPGNSTPELLDAYLERFAFLWWGFIALAVYALYDLNKQNSKNIYIGGNK